MLTEQDEQLRIGWAYIENALRDAGVGDWWLEALTIVAWQNEVLTLAGWLRERRWFARRYLDLTKTLVQSEKDVVLLTPRAGATIARKIKRDKENA